MKWTVMCWRSHHFDFTRNPAWVTCRNYCLDHRRSSLITSTRQPFRQLSKYLSYLPAFLWHLSRIQLLLAFIATPNLSHRNSRKNQSVHSIANSRVTILNTISLTITTLPKCAPIVLLLNPIMLRFTSIESSQLPSTKSNTATRREKWRFNHPETSNSPIKTMTTTGGWSDCFSSFFHRPSP